MSTKRISSEDAQSRAQSRATLAAQRRVEAESAMEALRIEQIAVRERTAKLRAMRLAKEAADAAAAAATAAAVRQKPAKAVPAKAVKDSARRRRATSPA